MFNSPAGGALRTDELTGAVRYLDPATGAVLATFTPDALKAVSEDRGGAYKPPTFRILSSRDGAVWSDDAVNELAGRDVSGVLRVTIVGERAVVAATLPVPKGSQEPSRQLALVGTPR